MVTLTFDRILKVITVGIADDEVTIQFLWNEIVDYLDELQNMELDNIAEATGKDDLGGSLYTAITLKLINDWRLSFAARPPPDEIPCIVSGGNLIAVNVYSDNPIKATAYIQVIIAQSTAAALLDASVSISSTDMDEIVDRVWDEGQSSHLGVGSTGEALEAADTLVDSDKDDIIDRAWNEALADHLTAGSTGEKLNATGTAVTAPKSKGQYEEEQL